jgi:HEAT repeat protein
MRRTLVAALLIVVSGCGQPQPPPRVSHWVQALRQPDARVRKEAAFKLGNLGPTDPAVSPALIGALKDADAGVRCEAILALTKCGPDAQAAIPVLADLQQRDPNARVRSYASKALKKLRGEDGAAG